MFAPLILIGLLFALVILFGMFSTFRMAMANTDSDATSYTMLRIFFMLIAGALFVMAFAVQALAGGL